MVTSELLAELHKLDRSDKLRVVQMLVNELAVEENSRLTAYPSRTLMGDEKAAQALLEALQKAEATDHGTAQSG